VFNWILLACASNTCRCAACIVALEGQPGTALARESMRARGLDLARHRARQLTSEMNRSFKPIPSSPGHQILPTLHAMYDVAVTYDGLARE
jgi:hypothetical protein